jgi:hypothetical protein
MQKIFSSAVIGILIASLVWGWAYRDANLRAEKSLDTIRAERDEAIGRAESLESELGDALSRVIGLEDTIRRLTFIIDEIAATSSSLDAGLREYGAINNDFRDFIDRNGSKDDDI